MKNKLFLLTLMSLASNSFCLESKNDDKNFDKEITIERGMVDQSGDIFRIGKQYAHRLKYYIPRESEDYSNVKKYTHYKLVLKKISVDVIPFLREGDIPVKIVRFELLPFDNISCTIL